MTVQRQFSPFAALTGHEAAIKETARLTDDKQILSEDVIEKINGQLKIIAENIGAEQEITVTYFVPDSKIRWRVCRLRRNGQKN